MNDFHESNHQAIAHVSFVDERRVDVFGEVVLDQNFGFELDELYQLGGRLFVVDEIFATYLDEKGRAIPELKGERTEDALLVVFVTCTLVIDHVMPVIGQSELRDDDDREWWADEDMGDPIVPCSACGGQLVVLGMLSDKMHARCRACGIDSIVSEH